MNRRQVDELTGRSHTHAVADLPVKKVAPRRVDREEEARVDGQGTFQDAIVGFVPDDEEMRQRIGAAT